MRSHDTVSKFAYVSIFTYVSEYVHVNEALGPIQMHKIYTCKYFAMRSKYTHGSKFVYVSIFTYVSEYVHVNEALGPIQMHKIYTCKYFAMRSKYTHGSKSIFTLRLHANSVQISILKGTHTCCTADIYGLFMTDAM